MNEDLRYRNDIIEQSRNAWSINRLSSTRSRKRRKGENAVFLSNALNLATIVTTTFLVDSQRDSPKAVFVF